MDDSNSSYSFYFINAPFLGWFHQSSQVKQRPWCPNVERSVSSSPPVSFSNSKPSVTEKAIPGLGVTDRDLLHSHRKASSKLTHQCAHSKPRQQGDKETAAPRNKGYSS